VAPFRFFLPSDPLQGSSANLVAFEGVTGVKVSSPRSYESFVTYRLRASEDNSRVKELPGYTIAPQWSGAVANLAAAYKEGGNEAAVPLRSPDGPVTIRFKVEGSESWTLRELEYELRNPKGVAARLFAPAFIPLP
jgi:hypothetical protein